MVIACHTGNADFIPLGVACHVLLLFKKVSLPHMEHFKKPVFRCRTCSHSVKTKVRNFSMIYAEVFDTGQHLVSASHEPGVSRQSFSQTHLSLSLY